MNNNQILFQNIKSSIINWVEENETYFNNNSIQMNILRNEKDGFVVNFENDIAMAEIVVEFPTYAPYRFVSFQIAAVEENKANIIYTFYDNEKNSINEIIKELNKGITYFINLNKVENI